MGLAKRKRAILPAALACAWSFLAPVVVQGQSQFQQQVQQADPYDNAPYNGMPSYAQAPWSGASTGGQPFQGSVNYGYNQYGNSGQRSPYYGPPYQAYPRPQIRYAYAPAGLVMPCQLNTSISTDSAGAGDYIQATIEQNVALNGLAYIPAGSVVQGTVVEAQAGRRLNRSGKLEIAFNLLRLPNGQSVNMSGHVLGDLGKYKDKHGVFAGEGWGAKLEGLAGRTLLGAGSGALFGTAVGAIAGGRWGSGLLGGLAIGGGLGAADSLVLRRGRNVLIHSGTEFQLQLDEPLQFPINWSPNDGQA